MTRSIHCVECSAKQDSKSLPLADIQQGWSRVFVPICAQSSLVCDSCYKELGGEICYAITMWRPAIESKSDWESGYGTVLPEETVNAVKVLTK